MQTAVHQTETLLSFTLLQLIVIVLAARLAGEIAVRLAQSRAVVELVASGNRRAVAWISAAGLAAPFALGALFAQVSHPHLAADINPLGYTLFTGTAFSITALPILGRILMELVVINVGLDLGVIPANVFTMLVIMAIVSTVLTTPALRIWLEDAARPPAGAGAAPR